jgi:hypothetical protein
VEPWLLQFLWFVVERACRSICLRVERAGMGTVVYLF